MGANPTGVGATIPPVGALTPCNVSLNVSPRHSHVLLQLRDLPRPTSWIHLPDLLGAVDVRHAPLYVLGMTPHLFLGRSTLEGREGHF